MIAMSTNQRFFRPYALWKMKLENDWKYWLLNLQTLIILLSFYKDKSKINYRNVHYYLLGK